MNVTEVVGDVVSAYKKGDIHIFAHGCNCMGVMGSGVASAVRDRIPSMYEAYMARWQTVGLVLGDYSYIFNGFQWGFNLNTQFDYGTNKRHVDYSAVRQCAEFVVRQVEADLRRTHYKHIEDLVIGIPKIGAGLGGGDWDTIIGILSKEWYMFKEIRVYVLE